MNLVRMKKKKDKKKRSLYYAAPYPLFRIARHFKYNLMIIFLVTVVSWRMNWSLNNSPLGDDYVIHRACTSVAELQCAADYS